MTIRVIHANLPCYWVFAISFLMLIIDVCLSLDTYNGTCTKVNACVCVFPNGGGINLTSIDKDHGKPA